MGKRATFHKYPLFSAIHVAHSFSLSLNVYLSPTLSRHKGTAVSQTYSGMLEARRSVTRDIRAMKRRYDG